MPLAIDRNHARMPIGGWSYRDAGEMLRGVDADDLLAKIEAHRATNALPLGDPEHDLAVSLLARECPWLVKNGARESTAPLSQRVAEWLMAVWHTHPKLLAPRDERVETRLTCCAVCPHLRPAVTWRKLYEAEAESRGAKMLADHDFSRHGWCSHHGWAVACAVRLDEPPAVSLLPVPESCWLGT